MSATMYDRRGVLSHKVRASTQLRKISRAEFFSRTQVTRTIEPLVIRAYVDVEQQRLASTADDSPHGHPWHTSFHASQFPGDDPMACSRQSLYRMMGFPNADPFSRRSRWLMEVGKAMEVNLVDTFHRAGILLSAAPDSPIQTGFEHPDAWLTGSVDAVIRHRNRPVPIEIKSKDRETVQEMQAGRGPDPAHVAQLKVQLALVALHQKELWPELDPLTHGFIYYMSRGDKKGEHQPLTAEFRVDLDATFFRVGTERLRNWAGLFQADVLPQENPSKKHPMGWRWSYPPCQYCNFKKTCKLDFQDGVSQLTDSRGIDRARLVRSDYDPSAARLAVLARWEDHRTPRDDE